MLTDRRGFIAGSAAALGAAALPAATMAQSGPVTIHLAGTPSDDMTPIIYGMKAGIFERAGIDLSLSQMVNGTAAMAGLVSGTFDIAKANIASVFEAHEKGLPFQIVAIAILYRAAAPWDGIIVPGNSGIRTGKDFNNLTVACPALGSISPYAIKGWVDQHGGDSKTVKIVEVPISAALAALENGRVQAAEMSYPMVAVAKEHGMRLIPVYDAIAPEFPFIVWLTTKDFSTKHPDLVRNFARAYGESATYTNGHHAETAQLMADYTRIPLPTVQKMLRGEAGVGVNVSQMQTMIDNSVRLGILKRSFPAQEIIDPNVR